MPDSKPRDGFFYLPLTPTIDSYILAYRIRIFANHTDLISHTLIRPVGIVCIIKNPLLEMKGMQKKKNLSWVWRTDRKIRQSGSQSDITRKASWCQIVNLGTDFFYLPLTPMIDSYILANRIRISSNYTDLISHTLIRPVEKIKIENFQVFGIQWLYMTTRYDIVKVDVMNVMTSLNGQ